MSKIKNRGLAGLLVGMASMAVPAVAMASVPPDRLGQAEADFAEFLAETEPDSEVLGWPDWVGEQIDRTDSDLILWTRIMFDGYTITWQGDEVLIYDETVSGA